MVTKWFNARGYREFGALGEYGESSAPVMTLAKLLNINYENTKPFTKDILDIEQQPEHFQASMIELSRGLHALLQFQDILDVSLDAHGTEMVNRHYAYYESLVYIRESIVSWLDGNVVAALTLLRPFQEMAVLHLYWYLLCRHNTYEPYYSWLRGNRGKPSFPKALNYVCDNMPSKGYVQEKRLRELKKIIGNIYNALSVYHHVTKMDDSIVAKSGGLGNLALEYFLYYLETVNIQLHQLVYVFVLAYPVSLFPVEKHKKWAFSRGPKGLFFDKTNYAILEGYLGSQNTTSLKQSLASQDEVQSLLNWFQSFPDLGPEEIDADWRAFTEMHHGLSKEDENQLGHRLAIAKSFNRSVGWALNYVIDNETEAKMSDEAVEQVRKRVRDW
jgi:hypothetical protein